MRNIIDRYAWLPSASKSATFSTDPIDSIGCYGIAVQVNISAQSGLTATLALEWSLDKTNWIVYPSSLITASANGAYGWIITEASPFNWLRTTATISAGSGTYQVILSGMRP